MNNVCVMAPPPPTTLQIGILHFDTASPSCAHGPLRAALAATSAVTATASATFPPTPEEAAADHTGRCKQDEGQEQYTLNVHSTRFTMKAAAQAMAHWETMMISAHVVPSSLRIVAMAATQGV